MAAPVLRPLSLGEILDVSFGLYRALFVPLLLVTVAARALPTALIIYLQSAGVFTVETMMYLLGWFVLTMIASALASAMSTFILSEHYMGRRITAGEAFRRSVPFIGRLFLLALLTGLLVGLGALLFIVPGVILFLGLVLAPPAMVIENKVHATDAMGRAWALSRGHRWKLLGCLVVTALLIAIPSLALQSGNSLLKLTPEAGVTRLSPAGIAWLAVAQGLEMLIYPLLYCVLTVAYYDLRVRKEAFDLEVLAAGLAQA